MHPKNPYKSSSAVTCLSLPNLEFLYTEHLELIQRFLQLLPSRSDLVDALRNQFINEAKELHDELETLRKKIMDKEKELQEKGFQQLG